MSGNCVFLHISETRELRKQKARLTIWGPSLPAPGESRPQRGWMCRNTMFSFDGGFKASVHFLEGRLSRLGWQSPQDLWACSNSALLMEQEEDRTFCDHVGFSGAGLEMLSIWELKADGDKLPWFTCTIFSPSHNLFKISEPTRERVRRQQALPEALPSYEGLSELPHTSTSLAQLLNQLVNQQTQRLSTEGLDWPWVGGTEQNAKQRLCH